MAYERPGVYVKEAAFTTNISNATGATPGAFIGLSARGPITPVLVTTWSQYKNVFGNLENTYDLGYAVYHFFANGGQACYVTRVIDPTAVTAVSVVQGTPTGGSAATLWALNAKSPGVWGNSLTINYVFDSDTLTTPTSAPMFNNASTFSMSVLLSGLEVELWTGLSTDPSSNRFMTTILSLYSNYVSTSSVATVASGTPLAISGLGVADMDVSGIFASGTDGSESIDASSWAVAVEAHDLVKGSLLFNLVNQTSSTVINATIATLTVRGDSFLIVDTPKTATTKAALVSAVTSYTASSYAAVYGPALKMFDPTKTGAAAVRDTFCGGAVVGAFVRSEVERGVSKAPAGYGLDIRNVFGIVANLTETEQGALYKDQQLNTFTIVPGVGVIINGSRTLARNTKDKFVTVRRSLNFLKATTKNATTFALFEPNDERLWSTISVKLSAMLTTFWGTGGLKGNTAGDAFYVVCSSVNNTVTSIDDGIVNIEIGVALQSPAEFIVISISQWTGGSTVTTSI